jgi:hypothetical protein
MSSGTGTNGVATVNATMPAGVKPYQTNPKKYNAPVGPGGRTYDIPGGPKGSLNPDGTPKSPTGPVGRYTPAGFNLNGTPTNSGTFQYEPEINQYAMPGMPDPFQFDIPQVEMRDFTEQAKKIAAEAFAPYLAAFDIARTNAQRQGDTSKEATKGLYANFVKDIAAKAAETAQRYDQTKAEQASRGEAQQADIAENQQSASANTNDQLAALGLETSIPTMAGQGQAQQANAQAQAGQASESQQQFYDSEKLAQGNYDTNFGLLQQKAGIGAQQDIDSQLMNVLTGIDINKANASGEQSSTALELAQTLANRDLQAQQANAGYSLQGQGMQYQQGQDAFANALGLNTTREQQIQNDYQNAFELWKAETGFGLEAAAAAGKAGEAAPFDLGDYPDKAKTYGYLVGQLGAAKADLALRDLSDILQEYKNTPEYMNPKLDVFAQRQAFARYARDQLLANGVPQGIAESAAATYYSENMS